MGGGKGGGGADAGPMLKYGDKALKLQERIYDESKQANQPYQTAGYSGLNELMMRLGLGTGSATGTRTADQIRSDLKGSYTTQPASNSQYYVSPDGRLLDISGDRKAFQSTYGNLTANDPTWDHPDYNSLSPTNRYKGSELARLDPEQRAEALTSMGYKQHSGGQASIDNAGLDAAVQRALSDQQAATAAAQQNPLYGSLLKGFSMDDYQEDPGYQFRVSEGNKALDRGMAASGQYMTPERLKALQAYGQGQASQEYGAAYDRYNMDQGNIFNRLAAIAGIGQTANAQQTQSGQNYANAATDLYTGMGNSIAAANQANQANKGGMFNTLLSTAGQIGSAYLMSDERLKENMQFYANENGHNVYVGNYINDPEKNLFFMVKAQEVMESNPEAVRMMPDGYYWVNYDAIGVKFRSAYYAH